MPSHRSHGSAVYIEPPRHDELPAGVPRVDPEQVEASPQRRADGTLAPGASTVPALGGKALKGRTRLSHRIDSPLLSPKWVRRARSLRRALAGEIAATVGGGQCGVAASLFLKFAAQKTAAAEEAFVAGNYEAHRKETESARMDILYAREHAAKLAQSRQADPAAWAAEVARQEAEAEAEMERQREAERRAREAEGAGDGDA